MKTVKIALGLPWYDGPNRDTAVHYQIFSHYLGRLQERLWWLANSKWNVVELPPPLDPVNRKSEIPQELNGTLFEFCICEEVGCSLPGMARERIVDAALAFGAEYILFWDADMLFGTDAFLRLYMDQKPVVGALAFTGRKPITPVIYKFKDEWAEDGQSVRVFVDIDHDYRRDELSQVDAFGSGMMMVQAEVFRAFPKPWFHSTGMGEDIFFCLQCKKAGIPVFVDTRVKTIHKPTFSDEWHDERAYDKQRLNGSDSHIQQPTPVSGYHPFADY